MTIESHLIMEENRTPEGNNNPSGEDRFRCRRYVFTIHLMELNAESHKVLIDRVINYLKANAKYYIVGEEKGKSGITPHLQGYVEFKNERMRKAIKEGMGIEGYFEKAKGNREANINYVSKEGGNIYTCEEPSRFTYEILLRPWQQELYDYLQGPIDSRHIIIYLDTEGGAGKSDFCKYYLSRHKDAMILEGKSNDMKHGIVSFKEKHKDTPRVCLIDLPKASQEHCNFGGFEKIKDMCFFSGKYEGGMVNGPKPHLIIFTNTPVPVEAFTKTKCIVKNITNWDKPDISRYMTEKNESDNGSIYSDLSGI